MTLPALNDTLFTIYRDEASSLWGCFVCDTARTVYGFTTGRSPAESLTKAVDIVTGRHPASALNQPTREAMQDIADTRGVDVDFGIRPD
jgi:hypothetical protein